MGRKRLFQFLNRYHFIVFVFALLVTYAIVGVFEVIDEHPQSIHMWAQTDRGSVALNYYEDNLNFFKPRIHNIDNETGRVGLEFPLMNYMAALCYELFGFHEGFYRALMLIVISGGILAAYALANKFLKSKILAGIITLLWASSPIIHFYSPNFLSGMASLGFAMGAWWCFFKQSPELRWKMGFFLLITLAGLVKITSGITIISMIILVSLKQIAPEKIGKKLKGIPADKGTILSLASSVIVIASWYLYSNYLKEFYESPVFLMHIKPVTNWADFKDIAGNFIAIWADHIYAPSVWIVILLSLLLFIGFIKKINPSLMVVTGLLFLGNAGFSFLMFAQLEYHDYYLLPMMNLPFFILLSTTRLGMDYFSQKPLPKSIKIGMVMILGGILIPALLHSDKIQNSRYNNSFRQFGVNYKPYVSLEPKLEKHGISRKDRVISMVDISSNISLYLMNRKGFNIKDDYSQFSILYRIYQKGDFIVANDTSFINFPSIEYFLDTPLFKHKGLEIYPIELNEKDRMAFINRALKSLQPMINHFLSPKKFKRKVKKYSEYFGLSLKKARLRQAFGFYPWHLNDSIKRKLKKHYPNLITQKTNAIKMTRFCNKNKDKVKKLQEKGVFNKLDLAVLKSELPLLLYDYKP